jgi:HK97 gp10 family phage protein
VARKASAMASELIGVADLTRKLNLLGAQVAAKELRGIARVAMKIAYQKALATIPVGTIPHTTYKGRRVFGGFAKRNLRLVSFIDKKAGSAMAMIGPRREAFYATQFVELGTSKMPARPWLRPAMESSQSAMLAEVKTQLVKRIRRLERR